jgi:hypothetical protein
MHIGEVDVSRIVFDPRPDFDTSEAHF